MDSMVAGFQKVEVAAFHAMLLDSRLCPDLVLELSPISSLFSFSTSFYSYFKHKSSAHFLRLLPITQALSVGLFVIVELQTRESA